MNNLENFTRQTKIALKRLEMAFNSPTFRIANAAMNHELLDIHNKMASQYLFSSWPDPYKSLEKIQLLNSAFLKASTIDNSFINVINEHSQRLSDLLHATASFSIENTSSMTSSNIPQEIVFDYLNASENILPQESHSDVPQKPTSNITPAQAVQIILAIMALLLACYNTNLQIQSAQSRQQFEAAQLHLLEQIEYNTRQLNTSSSNSVQNINQPKSE